MKKKRQLGSFDVHVQARAEPKGTPRRVDLPYRILCAGNLVPQKAADPSRIYSVDRNTFAPVLRELAPSLSLEVPNLISAAPRELPVELHFTEMNSFRPEGIARQVPPLARLVTVRSLLGRAKGGELSLAQFREEMNAAGIENDLAIRFEQALSRPVPPGPAPAPPKEGKPAKKERLDSLLDMVSLTPESDVPLPRQPTLADSFIAAASSADMTSGPGSGIDTGMATELMGELEGIVSEQITAILHHPEYQRLEASWRTLKFLVDRMDFRQNLLLSIIPAQKEELPEVLRRGVGEELSTTSGEGGAVPVGALFADYSFGPSPDDLGLLERLAETAEQLQLPVAAGADPSFFGKAAMAECASLPLLWQHFQEPQYLPWSKFRDTDGSAFLALALPHLLLRFPYGAQNPVKDFPYTEPVETETDCLWGNGAVMLALAAAKSFTESSWPTNLSGMSAAGRIEGLPLRQRAPQGGIPLSVLIPEGKQVELAEAGFSVMSCRVNSDMAYVAQAPVLHRPRDGGVESTLAYRLLATRVVHLLGRRQPAVPARAAKGELKARMAEWLAQAVGGAGGWKVSAVESESDADDPESLRISLAIAPPSELLGGESTITVHMAHRATG